MSAVPSPPSAAEAGPDHARFADVARRLAAPFLAAAQGVGLAAAMPVEMAPGSSRDRRPFSALEGLARLLCGLAPLLELQHRGQGPEILPLAEIQHLLAVSLDPKDPHRLDFAAGPQCLVEAAFLAQAVLRAPGALWSGLPAEARRHLAAALLSSRRYTPHFNNWLLFSAMVEAALFRIGEPWDRMRVDYALRQHEQWYAGDGLYRDGPKFRLDYYNGYVIQPMLQDILATFAEKAPWPAIAKVFPARMARLATLLERMIGPEGSFPPLGRSIAYRAAAFQPLAQLALAGGLPEALPPGQVRAALLAVQERTLGPASFDAAGWLRIGLTAAQPGLAEDYISTGSLYLCSTALLPLGLPPEAEFWTAPAAPWTQKRIWSLGEDHPRDSALER